MKKVMLKKVDPSEQVRPIELENIQDLFPNVFISEDGGLPDILEDIDDKIDDILCRLDKYDGSIQIALNDYADFMQIINDYASLVGGLTVYSLDFLLQLYRSKNGSACGCDTDELLQIMEWQFGGIEFDILKLHGGTSNEYCYACFPYEMSHEEIEKLETIVWNTGSQYEVIDSDTKQVLDTVYCYTNNETEELLSYAKENNYHMIVTQEYIQECYPNVYIGQNYEVPKELTEIETVIDNVLDNIHNWFSNKPTQEQTDFTMLFEEYEQNIKTVTPTDINQIMTLYHDKYLSQDNNLEPVYYEDYLMFFSYKYNQSYDLIKLQRDTENDDDYIMVCVPTSMEYKEIEKLEKLIFSFK